VPFDGLLLKLDRFDPAARLPEWKAMPLGAHESRQRRASV
jgi:hypothetical protein